MQEISWGVFSLIKEWGKWDGKREELNGDSVSTDRRIPGAGTALQSCLTLKQRATSTKGVGDTTLDREGLSMEDKS